MKLRMAALVEAQRFLGYVVEDKMKINVTPRMSVYKPVTHNIKMHSVKIIFECTECRSATLPGYLIHRSLSVKAGSNFGREVF